MSFYASRATGAVLFDLLLQMEAQFFIELPLYLTPAREGAEPHPQDMWPSSGLHVAVLHQVLLNHANNHANGVGQPLPLS